MRWQTDAGDDLLDLVLSDCAALASVHVAPEIADHRVVSLDVAIVFVLTIGDEKSYHTRAHAPIIHDSR